jgi:hypothetical protein
MDGGRLTDGIIAYLTRKQGGNVHDKGVVTITSKSIRSDSADFIARFGSRDYSVRNVADLNFNAGFASGMGDRHVHVR